MCRTCGFNKMVPRLHTNKESIDLCPQRFGETKIFERWNVNRQPRLCDLTPFDFYFCGYIEAISETEPVCLLVIEKELMNAKESHS